MHRRRIRGGIGLLAIATATVVGCGRSDPPATRTHQAGGEVEETWAPERLTSVRDVPVDAIRAAIRSSLDSAPLDRMTKDTWTHAKRLYGQYNGGPLWFKSKELDRERVGFLMRALANSDADALDLAAYPLRDVANAVNAVSGEGTVTAQQLALADLVLTAAYAALGEDLLTGQLDPRSLEQSWHIDPQEEKVDSALARTLRSEPLDRAIANMAPDDEAYAALKEELRRYRELAARGDWAAVPTGRTVKPGEPESPARLNALRARLAAEGLLSDSAAAPSPAPGPPASRPADSAGIVDSTGGPKPRPRPATARYDRTLAGAVAQYQARHNIPVDSMLGPETVASMNVPVSYRVAQIAANLERYRWLPRTLGDRYILVNVPAFRVEAYDGGVKALDMKVIVGAEYEGRATPVFSDSMAFVVFRPYWNPTDNISDNELWPKANADPGYLARNNYETFTEGGKTRIRQRPGEKNALGLVKFMFPNDFNIYLHDTPQDELFKKDVRALSHGCIRLEKPAEMAQWVLGWDAERVRKAMQGSNNRQVTLKKAIPVYIAYFTTYVRDSVLHFGNDLYKRDETVVNAMAGGALPSAAAIETATELRRIAEEWTK